MSPRRRPPPSRRKLRPREGPRVSAGHRPRLGDTRVIAPPVVPPPAPTVTLPGAGVAVASGDAPSVSLGSAPPVNVTLPATGPALTGGSVPTVAVTGGANQIDLTPNGDADQLYQTYLAQPWGTQVNLLGDFVAQDFGNVDTKTGFAGQPIVFRGAGSDPKGADNTRHIGWLTLGDNYDSYGAQGIEFSHVDIAGGTFYRADDLTLRAVRSDSSYYVVGCVNFRHLGGVLGYNYPSGSWNGDHPEVQPWGRGRPGADRECQNFVFEDLAISGFFRPDAVTHTNGLQIESCQTGMIRRCTWGLNDVGQSLVSPDNALNDLTYEDCYFAWPTDWNGEGSGDWTLYLDNRYGPLSNITLRRVTYEAGSFYQTGPIPGLVVTDT